MLLLQIEQAINQSFISRLSDQLFCIVLLVAYAVYSNRRQSATEQKLEKYMQDDRAKMTDVIASNTRAFENLTLKLGSKTLFLLIGSMFLLSSCGLFRKSVKTEISTRDSLAQVMVISDYHYSDFTTEVKDTILNIPARSVTGIIEAPDLKPIFTISGDTLPRSHTIQGKGVNVSLKVLPSGALEVTGNCDSMQQVVAGLIRQNKFLKESSDSTKETYQSEIARFKETQKQGWLGSLTTYLCAMAISFACGFLIHYLKRK